MSLNYIVLLNVFLQQHKYSKAKVLQLPVEVICRHSGLNITDNVVTSMVVNNKVVLLVPLANHLMLEVPVQVLLVQVAPVRILVVVVGNARLVVRVSYVFLGCFMGQPI